MSFVHMRGVSVARLFATIGVVSAWSLVMACSSAPKRTTPELSRFEGKKVAIVEIEGEQTARTVVEVALVNELIRRGTFTLISKQDIESARAKPGLDPLDLKNLAREAGADIALRINVLQFDANVHEGYSSEEVEDSQLAAERGKKEGKTKRLYKVKSMNGKVRVDLEFNSLADNDVRQAVAASEETVTIDEKHSAIHLPPKLGFLEKLAGVAFKEFFERYR